MIHIESLGSVGNSAFIGDLLILAGTICWASYIALSKPILSSVSPLQFVTYTVILGSPIVIFASLPSLLSLDLRKLGKLEHYKLLSTTFNCRSLHHLVLERPKNWNRTNGYLPKLGSIDRSSYRLANSRWTATNQTTSWWRDDFPRNLSYKIFQLKQNRRSRLVNYFQHLAQSHG